MQKKFEGTRVTIENFLAWKTKFDAEMAELNKRKNDNEIAKSKLTGNCCLLTSLKLELPVNQCSFCSNNSNMTLIINDHHYFCNKKDDRYV